MVLTKIYNILRMNSRKVSSKALKEINLPTSSAAKYIDITMLALIHVSSGRSKLGSSSIRRKQMSVQIMKMLNIDRNRA